MAAALHRVSLPGSMLQRGFWLYVWRIHVAGEVLLYVGRTGDESSAHASAPYDRFGQHLGRNKNANALKRNLQARGLRLEQIDAYDFVFHGPIFDEVDDLMAHKPLRDIVAALEKELAGALGQAGYTVLNAVNCRRPLDPDHWATVKASFAVEFPGLDQTR
ncbi:MAG: hypothetical protein FD162_3588 [Rhodobacteraceae bacterium]|nr:MAG: hypothetical protein FD162_3588 [Paracoccaceae bacterium]